MKKCKRVSQPWVLTVTHFRFDPVTERSTLVYIGPDGLTHIAHSVNAA